MFKELIEYVGANLQAIGVLTTLIMAIITAFTLLTLRKQVNNAQRPILSFTGNIFAKYLIKEPSYNIIWYNDTDENIGEYSTLSYQIINVGLGMATDVKIKECYDVRRIIKHIKRFDYDDDIRIKKVGSKKVISVKEQDSFVEFMHLKNDDYYYVNKLGNIFTASFNSNKPSSYYIGDLTINFFTILALLDEKHNLILLDDFPKTKYILKYRNADGKKYSNRFIMSILPFGKTFSLTFTQYSKRRWIWYNIKDFFKK